MKNNFFQQPAQPQSKDKSDRQAQFYFNAKHDPNNPYQDTNSLPKPPSPRSHRHASPRTQNLLANGHQFIQNTINNNFNIINNIMPSPSDLNNYERETFNHTAPLQGISHTVGDGLDAQILASLSNKLGYNIEDIKKCVREENSFVQVLYNKMLEDQQHSNRSIGTGCGKVVHPSVVPSIASMASQISHSLNSTQPLDRSQLGSSFISNGALSHHSLLSTTKFSAASGSRKRNQEDGFSQRDDASLNSRLNGSHR